MILDALESFLVFGTVLALAGFTIVGLARLVGRTARLTLPPRIFAGLCTGAVVAPPVVAAWLVAAAHGNRPESPLRLPSQSANHSCSVV